MTDTRNIGYIIFQDERKHVPDFATIPCRFILRGYRELPRGRHTGFTASTPQRLGRPPSAPDALASFC